MSLCGPDEVLRQKTGEYLNMMYDTVNQPKQDGNLEHIEQMLVSSFPESLRQEVANEASIYGTLSDGLTERIRRHLLDVLVQQQLPEDLRVDIANVLEEYRATGQVNGNNEELVQRIHLYREGLEQNGGRNTRGFWGAIAAGLVINFVSKMLGLI